MCLAESLQLRNFEAVSGYEQASSCRNNNHDVAFALGIISAPSHSTHRSAIRKTWLRLPNKYNQTFTYRFFVGTQQDGAISKRLAAESSKYGDIAVIGAQEGYGNIKYKAVGIFRWGVRKCGAYYVMRANDDVFLRLEPLMTALYATPPTLMYSGKKHALLFAAVVLAESSCHR